MNELIRNVVNAVSLKGLQGKRSQLGLLVMGVVNILVACGILHWDQAQLNEFNKNLGLVIAYFFAEKVSK